jgi:hypothetical protein
MSAYEPPTENLPASTLSIAGSGIAISTPNASAINLGTAALTAGSLNCGSQLIMTSDLSANRSINNVFYNLNDATTFTHDGRIYANGTFIFYEGSVNNGCQLVVLIQGE